MLARRPDIQAELDEIDQQLGDDLRIRTRVTRLEQPDNIVHAFGPRPAGRDAIEWDDTAGRLAQHHAAFDRTRPRPPTARSSVDTDIPRAIEPTGPHDHLGLEQLGRALDDLGIDL